MSQSTERARSYLEGERRSAEDALALVKSLRSENQLGTAARVARKALGESPGAFRVALLQNQMVCTYKDPEREHGERFQDAEDIAATLEASLPGMSDTELVETCGIVGAMLKYRWFRSNRLEDLESSLAWYSGRPAGKTLSDPEGYTRINAAFVLDLIAVARERSGLTGEAERNRDAAAALRLGILKDLRAPGAAARAEGWWILATVFEAYFGLGRYDEARQTLIDAAERNVKLPSSWERASTVAQIMGLAALHATRDPSSVSKAGPALEILTGDKQEHLRVLAGRRIGLALSGGGFRASLYHIGVLAKLADLDLLRHVEVLSCVSGGSIVGASYYLALRHELQTNPDAEIRDSRYVTLVKDLADQFLAGVQENLRNRMLSRGWKFWSSSSERLGDLYDSELFEKVRDELEARPRYLDELRITPPGQPDFHPAYDNWQRAAKVPILVLNSTTLNTGHNWQFTATFLGEPEPGHREQLGDTEVFPRAWFTEAGVPRIRLGHAVAASACVPGLFEPIDVRNLYQKVSLGETPVGYVTRLVDGGVCDNQGVASLLDHNCDVVLVSDASGQMPTAEAPAKGRLAVYQRTTSMLMARVRELQYAGLDLQTTTGRVRNFLYIHLKRGLRPETVRVADRAAESAAVPRTKDDLNVKVVTRLAEVRTDLDAFNTVEAYALMYAGYRMMEKAAPERLGDLVKPQGEEVRADWKFLAIEPVMRSSGGPDVERLTRLLTVGANPGFKIWRLRTPAWLSRLTGRLLQIVGWLPRGVRVVLVVALLATLAFWPWPAAIPLPDRGQRLRFVALAIPCVALGWAALFWVLRRCDRAYVRWGEDLLRPRPGA